MEVKKNNLSEYDEASVPPSGDMKFGVVVATWNKQITDVLLEGVLRTLQKHEVKKENIIIRDVPGSFELTLGAQLLADHTDVDAIICVGCVIQGETRHFDFICQSVTYGITQLNMKYSIPFIFCVLTTQTLHHAMERAGGKNGNKGDEAAVSAIRMAHLKKNMEQRNGH